MDAPQARRLHEERLMTLPHVTAVGVGQDESSGEAVIVVFVTHKVPREQLRPEDVIPDELEGFPVRVLAMSGNEETSRTEEQDGNDERSGTEEQDGNEEQGEA